MSDCFDHELDALESMERAWEEGYSITYDDECNMTVEMEGSDPELTDVKVGMYADIDEDDDRPEDFTPNVQVEKNTDAYWTRFGDPEQSSSFYGDWDGKYLFFSDNRQLLLSIAVDEIKEWGFKDAKVSIKPNKSDYVLCLYWRDDERGYELMNRHGHNSELRYRWWKSNADTRAGKYSK